MNYAFGRSGWRNDAVFKVIHGDGLSFDDWLEINGFNRYADFAFGLGGGNGLNIQVHQAKVLEDGQPEYLVCFDGAYSCRSLLVDDLPSLIALLKDLAPIVSCAVQTVELDERDEDRIQAQRQGGGA